MEAAAAAPAKKSGKEGSEDLSMEEILHSIREIIADEGDAAKPAASNGAASPVVDDDVPGSNVLELTEMLADDGSVVNVKEAAAPPAAAEAPVADILNTIDAALTPPPTPAPPAPPPAPVVAEVPKPVVPPAPAPAAMPTEALLSDQAAGAAAASLKKLDHTIEAVMTPVLSPSPEFRSGSTVEDLIMEMLKPMMKGWLDENLPTIVERIVEREVRKLTRP